MFSKKCLHDWEVKDKTLTITPWEHLIEKWTPTTIATCLFNQTYILVLACKKCGKLDKTIEEIRP